MLFSVIVPTYNRPEGLEDCLDGLASLPTEVPFEVIVVDDGGRVDLSLLVERYQSRLQLILLSCVHGGPAQARNVGAHRASGSYLIFLDDDCRPEPEWLERWRLAHERNPGAVIGGRTVNTLRANPYASASQLLIDYLYEYYGTSGSSGRFFTSNNFGAPRRPFFQVGGFDTGFRCAAGEDREFCQRWSSSGWPLIYDPSIIVGHAHSLNLGGYLMQHFRYGKAARRYWKLRGQRMGEALVVEPLAFYLRLLAYPVARYGLCRWALKLSLLFLLAQAANLVGYVRAGGQSTDR